MREDAKLTQDQVAKEMGVHKSYVSHVERATVNISVDTYEAYMNALFPFNISQGAAPIRVHVGIRIRLAREGRKITQEELAELTGFSVVYIGQVELGQTNTSLDRLERIGTALQESPGYLLTFESRASQVPDTLDG